MSHKQVQAVGQQVQVVSMNLVVIKSLVISRGTLLFKGYLYLVVSKGTLSVEEITCHETRPTEAL